MWHWNLTIAQSRRPFLALHREDKGLDIPKYHSRKTFFFFFWVSIRTILIPPDRKILALLTIFRSWIKIGPSQSGWAAVRKFSTAWFPWSGVLQVFLMLQGSEQSQGAESTWPDKVDEMQLSSSLLILPQASCCRRPARSEIKVCIINVCPEEVFGQLTRNSSSFTLPEQGVWKMSFPPHLYLK